MNPKGPGKSPGSHAEWMIHAESDLKIARLAVSDTSIRREQVCFHAQQAAEKTIKAVLLSQKIEFPLTHDIEELLEIAENNGIQIPERIREAGFLTPYAVETRYPGFWHVVAEADVKEALGMAELIMAWARKKLASSHPADS